MYRSLCLMVIVLFFPLLSKAQITAHKGTQTKQITYSGKIVDAETGEPLPFAQINHIYKIADKDSLIVRNFIADKDGKFEFQSPRVMNNRIEIICLGYKIHTRMLSEAGNRERISYGLSNISIKSKNQQPQIYNQFDLGILKLTPDVQQLDEVKVTARIKLFELSGDTLLVFPKNIKQFEGETLVDILKRLPNFHVDELGNIYVDGKRIERAMLNDKHIFGEDVRTMVTSLMAKEAGLIKVYDEVDETDEILKGKELARKRKVMNVITFKDFNLFKGGEIYLEAGLYADKDVEGKQQTMYDANGKIGQYSTGFRIAVEGNTKETAFPQRKQETGTGINAEVSSPDLLKSIGINYNYGKNEWELETKTEQFYFPTTYFESQIAERNYNNLQDKQTHQFGLTGKFIKKSIFSLIGGYSGSIEDVEQQSLSLSNITKDGNHLTYLQQVRENNTRNYNHSANLELTPTFGKWGSIQFAINGTIAKKSKEEIRVDSSNTREITDKQIFTISENNPEHRISSHLRYNKRMGKFSVHYSPSIRYEQSEQLYWVVDHLTGKIDSITSRNQILNNLNIQNEIGYDIPLNNNKFYVGTSIIYNTYKFQLEERFPENLQTNKKFHTWNGKIFLNYKQNIRFSFNILDTPFPIKNLSTRLIDENPMNLNAGNPNLKMAKNYDFNFNFNLKNYGFIDIHYQIITNPILSARRYFVTDTQLPEFDNYEALAGAILTTPTNAKNYNQFLLAAQSGFQKGVMMVKGNLSYSFKNPETDMLGEIVRSYEHNPSGTLSLLSNFSSTFRLDIKNHISYTHINIKATESQKYNRVYNNLMIQANLNLFYRMMVNIDYKHRYHYNSRTKQTNNIQTLNAFIDYRIFPNRRGLVSFKIHNLLNTKSSLTTTSTTLYMQNAYRPENSTLISVSFLYKFGVEE